MFKSTQELKDFITWAKQQDLKHIKVGDVELEFSELARALSDMPQTPKTPSTLKSYEPSDEELLFASARP